MTSENVIQNPDGWFLENRQINPESNLTPMQQAMRIALYDEYRSHATYQKVVDTFGPINPFAHIVQAEERHIAHMEALLMQHGVPPVANDWYPRVSVYASLVENCEAGVAAEIQNIAMYDQLLLYAETPDVRDTFFRLQAASFNHHLSAFRSCVAAHYGQDASQPEQNEADHADMMQQIQKMIGQAQQGKLDPTELQQQLQSLLSGVGSDFLMGGAVGAILGAILGGGVFGQNSDEQKTE